MAIEYLNRKRQKYYLHQGETRTGKPKYFFSMTEEGTLVDFIPAGYEIYENPNAQVFLRKIPPQVFDPKEIETVKAGIKKYAKIKDFIVDVKGNNIIVYLCDQDADVLMEIVGYTPNTAPERVKEALAQSFTYSPMMQFVLEDAETREFVVERWCFRGSVDDWIPLDHSTNLKELVKKYGFHLGKESFFDLIPMY